MNQTTQVQLPKKVFKTASFKQHDQNYLVTLDARVLKVPAGGNLLLPTKALAGAISREWQALGERIDPARLPLTRLANSAQTGIAKAFDETLQEITRYGGHDLVCYRAEGPDSLIALQSQAWDPVLSWAASELNARFICISGIISQPQPPEALAALQHAVRRFVGEGATAPFYLAALAVIVALSGSALIALRAVQGKISGEKAWSDAHIDEDFNRARWGEDEEASQRRQQRREDFFAALAMVTLLHSAV